MIREDNLTSYNSHVDHLLTSGVFGNTDAILKTRWAMYELLLQQIARLGELDTLNPFLARPTTDWQRVFDDPLLRIRFHEAYGVIRCGHPIGHTDFARLISTYSEYLASGNEPLVVHSFGNQGTVGDSNLIVLDTDLKFGWSHIQEEFLDLFRGEVLINQLTGVVREGGLQKPDISQRSRIELAFSLLKEVLPSTIQNATLHASLLALAEAHTIDAEMGSGTARSIPGLIFMSNREMRSVWTLAEALLHELTHCKLFDLYLGRRIFHSDYNVENAAIILSPWNSDTEYQSNEWQFDKALAAYHVYVHLAAFAACIKNTNLDELEQRYGPKHLNASIVDAGARARYLGAQLIRYAEAHLADDGMNLVCWLGEILDTVDPPPAQLTEIKYIEPISQQFKPRPFSIANSGESDLTLVLRHEPVELVIVDSLSLRVLNELYKPEAKNDWEQFFPRDIPSVANIGNLLIAVDELQSLNLIESLN